MIILNSKFQVLQDPVANPILSGDWPIDQWRAASSGFNFAQGAKQRGAVITLAGGNVGALFQPVLDRDTPVGETYSYSVVYDVLAGSPVVKSAVLAWNGTTNKPTPPVQDWATLTLNAGWSLVGSVAIGAGVISRSLPNTIENMALLVWVEGSSGDSVLLEKVGDTGLEGSYLEELRACSYFYQVLGTKYHANEQIFYGRIISATQAHMELPLPFQIRGADGSEGVQDVSVTWGGITFNTTATDGNMWVYSGGVSRRVSSAPVLTCVHRQNCGLGFTFTCSQGGLTSAHVAVARSYYANQAAIDSAVNTDMIRVDARLK